MSKPNIFNPKFIAEAEAKGLVLLGEGKSTNYRTYKLICGHIRELQPIRVRYGQFKCNDCIKEKRAKNAKAIGLRLIGGARSGQYRTYLLPCGHMREIQPDSINRNIKFNRDGFDCVDCVEEKHSAEAENVGAILLGKGKDCHYRSYRLRCGHSREIQPVGVRRNNFTCHKCEETSRVQPSSVYLLRIIFDNFTWLKLGYTKTIKNRISEYGLPNNSQVEILAVCNFDTGNEAHAFEAATHKLHARHKLDQNTMKGYHTNNGQTECYPTWMAPVLQATIEYEANKE